MNKNKTLLRERNKGYIFSCIFIVLKWLFLIVLLLKQYSISLMLYYNLICVLWFFLGRKLIFKILWKRIKDNENICIWRKDEQYIENKSYYIFSLYNFGIYLISAVLLFFNSPFMSFSLIKMSKKLGVASSIMILVMIILLILSNLHILMNTVVLNSVDPAIKKLRLHSPHSLATESIVMIINETSIGPEKINKLSVYKGSLEPTIRNYLLEESQLNKIFAGKAGYEAIRQYIKRWCYLVQIENDEELKACFDRAYQERNQESISNGLETTVILNYNPKGIPLNLPIEYKNFAFLRYMEIDDLEEISFVDIWNCAGGKGDHSRKDSDKFLWEQVHYYFQHPEVFLQRINSSNEFQIDYKGGNPWLIDFYKNACVFQNQSRSIMAMLDYMELLIRLVSIYYYEKSNPDFDMENQLITGNLLSIAKLILKNSVVNPKKHEKLMKVEYNNSELLQSYLKKLEVFLYISFRGERVSFLGLVSLIQVVRNKMVAHGVINESNAPVVWGLLFYAAVMLNNFLDVKEFRLVQQENGFLLGYGEDLVDGGNLVINRDGFPCIASIKKKNKSQTTLYVNYFNGELIMPEYIA